MLPAALRPPAMKLKPVMTVIDISLTSWVKGWPPRATAGNEWNAPGAHRVGGRRLQRTDRAGRQVLFLAGDAVHQRCTELGHLDLEMVPWPGLDAVGEGQGRGAEVMHVHIPRPQ